MHLKCVFMITYIFVWIIVSQRIYGEFDHNKCIDSLKTPGQQQRMYYLFDPPSQPYQPETYKIHLVEVNLLGYKTDLCKEGPFGTSWTLQTKY